MDSQIDEQVVKKFDKAFNNDDAAALAALYTQDAVRVTPRRPVCRSGGHPEAFARMFPAGELQQPSQQG